MMVESSTRVAPLRNGRHVFRSKTEPNRCCAYDTAWLGTDPFSLQSK